MRTFRRLLGAAALLVGAAAPAALSAAPVHAAAACTPQGVTVVVDFGKLGGGVQQGCATGGGTAATLLSAHHTLERVQDTPGAVCSVDGKPGPPCPRMPPANAYWGLFWSDGTSSHWTYASLGVDALRIPAGGAVALAWQSSAGTRSPSFAAPVTKAAAPVVKPTKAPKPTSTKKSVKKPATKPVTKPATKSGATSTPSASPSVSAGVSPSAVAAASPSAKAKKRPHASASGAPSPAAGSPTATASATTSASPSTTTADAVPTAAHSGSGLPGWVAPGVVVVVLAAGGGVVARRRLRG